MDSPFGPGQPHRFDQGDIVARLRNTEEPAQCWGCQEWGCRSTCDCPCHDWPGIVREAADEIERLRAEQRCQPPQGIALEDWCTECAAIAAHEEARRER